MWARALIFGATAIFFIPAVLLSFSPLAVNRGLIILLPVMGYYPMSMRSGDPGYNVVHAEIAGVCFLIAFATLAARVSRPWLIHAVKSVDEIAALLRRNIQKNIALDGLLMEMRRAV